MNDKIEMPNQAEPSRTLAQVMAAAWPAQPPRLAILIRSATCQGGAVDRGRPDQHRRYFLV